MHSPDRIKQDIYKAIQMLVGDKEAGGIGDNTPLLGGDAVLNSMRLVELCLLLEDKAEELGFEFDWTSESAMSRSRGMFRTAEALASEFLRQMEENK